jgi:hypothetical protein
MPLVKFFLVFLFGRSLFDTTEYEEREAVSIGL